MYSHIFVTYVINNKVEICEFAVTDGQMGRNSSLHSSLSLAGAFMSVRYNDA